MTTIKSNLNNINKFITNESSNLNLTSTLPLLPKVPLNPVLTISVSIFVTLEIYDVLTKIEIYKPTKSDSAILA